MESKTTTPIYIHFRPAEFSNIDEYKKIEKYCEKILGQSFRSKVDQMINGFISKISLHIKNAEQSFGKDYLEIKE